jgi:uncharacterized protein YdhG (YjbR/CyaY superfamily)
VSEQEIDAYLVELDEPKQSTLRALRQMILEILPEAEQGISYGMPAFKIDGHVVAGFAAFKNHLSYFPHSGSVIPEISEDAAPFTTSKGTLQFPVDTVLPRALVEQLISVRMRQASVKDRRRP